MKRLSKKDIEDWIAHHEAALSATQTKLCVPIIERIYRKMLLGITFAPIKIDGQLICDGHHRFVAACLADFPLQRVPTASTSATKVTDWPAVMFDEDDWDTPAKIAMLNEQDADYNNLSVEELIALIG